MTLYGTDCASTDYDDTPERMSKEEARTEALRRRDAGEIQDLAGALFAEPTPYPWRVSVGGHDFLIRENGTVEDA